MWASFVAAISIWFLIDLNMLTGERPSTILQALGILLISEYDAASKSASTLAQSGSFFISSKMSR